MTGAEERIFFKQEDRFKPVLQEASRTKDQEEC